MTKGEKKMCKVKFLKLKENARIPATGNNPGLLDLYACLDDPIGIQPGQSVTIGTGLSFVIPKDYCALILAKNKLAVFSGIRPACCVGTYEDGYVGEYKITLYNDSDDPFIVTNGEVIAKIMFIPIAECEMEEMILDTPSPAELKI